MDIFDFSDGREGYYGEYGGVFLPEILHATIEELLVCFRECKSDPKFWQDYVALMQSYSGRPTPVTHLKTCHASWAALRFMLSVKISITPALTK